MWWITLHCGTLKFIGIFSGVMAMSTVWSASNYVIQPQPDWVVPVAVPAATNLPKDQLNYGEYYLLVDEQTHVEREESFGHYAKVFINETGVQEGARLQFAFDPTYQELAIHWIRLIRGGQVLDRLHAEKIKLIQQETDLERHIYNGALSAVLFLDDVRVGDQLDYAFTIRGRNPIFDGRFLDSARMQATSPFRKQIYRTLWATNRAIVISQQGEPPVPTTRLVGGLREHLWEVNDAAPLVLEGQTPTWFFPYAMVEFTEFASWNDVARWAVKLYQTPTALPPELVEKISFWQGGPDEEARLLAALQFVQDEVRYLGLEFGPFTHQPSDPEKVFTRRFGDCKDKALLLCTILKAMGIEASPALVNTYRRHTIADRPPSPAAFNHVIVHARIAGRSVWVDPTSSAQRGPITARYLPDYGRCLLVQTNTVTLTEIPFESGTRTKMECRERFVMTSYDRPVQLEVTTIFNGYEAEYLRSRLETTSREKLSRDYLNYYAAVYPKIKATRPLDVRDDPQRNVIETVEHYTITDFWELAENKNEYLCTFNPLLIRESFAKPDITVRTTPLALAYPRHRILHTEVELPEETRITRETKTVSHAAARLDYRVEYTARKLTLRYEYQTLADHLPVKGIADSIKKIGEMRELLGYSLTRPNGKAPKVSGGTNWLVLILANLYAIILIGAAVVVYRWIAARSAALPPVIETEGFYPKDRLNGLGGWLILVGFGLYLRALFIVGTIFMTAGSYDLETWQALTNPGSSSYHALWAPVLIYELLVNITLLVFTIFLLILFHQKRAVFPRLMIALLVTQAIVMVLDHILAQQIPYIAANSGDKTMRQMNSAVFGAILWTAYLLVSKRVKATFIR